MKRFIMLFVLIAFAALAAQAEQPALPEIPGVNAYESIVSDESFGEMRTVTVELETGEQIRVDIAADGSVIGLSTSRPAEADPQLPQERAAAEEAVRLQYPEALILSGEDGPNGEKRILFITPELAGYANVHGDIILSRGITFGIFIEGDILTEDGAREALVLQRREASIAEIELDWDDGALIYEGEACVDGVEYEFEMSAYTGKLLEWERD